MQLWKPLMANLQTTHWALGGYDHWHLKMAWTSSPYWHLRNLQIRIQYFLGKTSWRLKSQVQSWWISDFPLRIPLFGSVLITSTTKLLPSPIPSNTYTWNGPWPDSLAARVGIFGFRKAISVGNFVERLLRGSRAIDAEAQNWRRNERRRGGGDKAERGKFQGGRPATQNWPWGIVVCYWLRSDVRTRAQACFGHCKRCKRCVFLRACHVNYLLGLLPRTLSRGVGVGWDGMC